jgi:hydrogenase expression/formation protein HypD
MEVCGTHTAAIFKSGIRSFLSPKIRLVSGPGCPVCVTVSSFIDRCIEISLRPDHELLCFGDLLKIPGTERTLSDVKGAGGRVRMVWSPFDAVDLAQRVPDTTFVVAAIGFETTTPAFALLLEEAKAKGIVNIKLLTSLKSALSAIEWICETGEAVDAFLCPGHVSVVTGTDAYRPFAEKYGKPFIIAGFEGAHLIAAIRAAVERASEGKGGVRNFYAEAASAGGNAKARMMIQKYFDIRDTQWRGLGSVRRSGYFLKEEFGICDAGGTDELSDSGFEPDGCRCGDVILGRIDPGDCPLFGKICTPSSAVGSCMVSAEGACGVWYREYA